MRLFDVQKEIEIACREAKRDPKSVTLIAVSKSQPIEKISALLDQGHRTFGENRVQEAMEKFPALKEKYPDLRLHMIGQLQTNKVKEAVKIFDCIHTVDREKLAAALSDEMQKQSRTLPCFIQVNTGDEPQKGGIAPRDLEKLLRFCRKETALQIIGLMCIPPAGAIPDLHFALLHKLSREFSLPSLSQGMSADFQTAIRYGATHIRLGTALFNVLEK